MPQLSHRSRLSALSCAILALAPCAALHSTTPLLRPQRTRHKFDAPSGLSLLSVIGGLMIAGSAGVKSADLAHRPLAVGVRAGADGLHAESAVVLGPVRLPPAVGLPVRHVGREPRAAPAEHGVLVLLRRFGEGGMTVTRAAADAAFFVLLLLALAAWPPSCCRRWRS